MMPISWFRSNPKVNELKVPFNKDVVSRFNKLWTRQIKESRLHFKYISYMRTSYEVFQGIFDDF